jgi:hypothetical protein
MVPARTGGSKQGEGLPRSTATIGTPPAERKLDHAAGELIRSTKSESPSVRIAVWTLW